MRMYSDSERSSALARRDSASSRDGVTRSLISSVHFSGISNPQKETGAAVVGLRRREALGIPAVANPGTTAREGERAGIPVMSGGFLVVAAGGTAQVFPVDIWPQIFAENRTAGFALDIDRQRLTASPAVGHVPKLADRCSATLREVGALLNRHCKIVVREAHTRMIFTIWCCRQHYSVNSHHARLAA